jgi:hypothetical protein
MRKSLLAVSLTAATALLMTGCAKGVERVDGAAAPVVRASASSAAPTSAAPASAAPSSSPPTSSTSGATGTTKPAATTTTRTTTTSSSSAKVVGPFGVGKLKLGQSKAQAGASGLITKWVEVPSDWCPFQAKFTGGPVVEGMYNKISWSKKYGVSLISIYTGQKTPEGIGLGSSRSQVEQAYPSFAFQDSSDPDSGAGVVPAPGNSAAQYRIYISPAGVVDSLTLQQKSTDCYKSTPQQ